jgi:hypothetical protein
MSSFDALSILRELMMMMREKVFRGFLLSPIQSLFVSQTAGSCPKVKLQQIESAF